MALIPETGRSPWVIIPPGLAIVAVTYGLSRYSFGLFIPVIRDSLDLDIGTIGLIASTSYAGYIVATLLASVLSGIIGPRLPVVVGGIMATLGMLLVASAHTPWQLALGIFIAGSSPGFAYPPLSDAISRLVSPEDRDWTYSIINCGTSLGVIFSGPFVLLMGFDWRTAWGVFAGMALLATLWNARVMPAGPFVAQQQTHLQPLTFRWLLNVDSFPLFLSATIFGLTTSVFWTFSVEYTIKSGGIQISEVTIFWIVIGIAGVLGGFASTLIDRMGLYLTLLIGNGAIALSLFLILLFPSSIIVIGAAAVLFGSTFILVSGVYGIWSLRLFAARPSAGFGCTFLLISLGQLIGPAITGVIAQNFGLAPVFAGAAIAAAAAGLIKPHAS